MIVEKTVQLVNADRCTLYLLDKNMNELYSEFYYGMPVKKITLPLNNKSIGGYCGFHKIKMNIADAYGDIGKQYKGLKFDRFFDKLNHYRTKSILCLPLVDGDNQLLGVISLLNSASPHGFSKKDEFILENIVRHTIISINRLQRQELAKIFSETDQKKLLGSQKRFVAFFDIIEYTRLSEALGDDKIKKILQAWEEDHIRLINAYGGIYVKSVGDEIMSLFGMDALSTEPQPPSDPFGINPITLDTFIRLKQKISNHTNLNPFILKYTHWFETHKDRFDQKTLHRAEKFKQSLWAENVIRFMYMAQKNMIRLNHFFFAKKILTQEKKHRVFIKGGAEFGSIIIDFDFYGRIDAIGDTVNVASRITDKGNNYSIFDRVVEQPLLIGPNFNALLPQKEFINKTKNYIRVKGKEDPIYIYSIDSLKSLENRALIPQTLFSRYKKEIGVQMNALDRIEQKTLPFNYAIYKIEMGDKYLVDHSKRVAINSLHIIDLINKHIEKNESGKIQTITFEQKKTTVIVALLHDIGKHALNDQVKAYIDPTKSIRELNRNETRVFNRLVSSLGCSIMESIHELRSFAYLVKYSGSYFNDSDTKESFEDNPSKEKLPIECRIVAIANAIDSILSDTPFREKLDIQALINIFHSDMDASKKASQIQKFDPKIVSILIEYYQQVLLEKKDLDFY
ncbi:MAG: GAF domain-containing protein [Desulfobacter sp.]|nr:GAF domain-containing protein [Desulfobacter sp.]